MSTISTTGMRFIALAAVLAAGVAMSVSVYANQGFRPPAVPLVTVDPYFSIWSMADRLADDYPKHWTGVNNTLAGMARIDGKTYRFMAPVGKDVTPMEQLDVAVTPTRSIYRMQGGGVELDITFTTPLLLDNLDVLSRPASYIEYEAKSIDGREHDVTLYTEATGEMVVDRAHQKVEWSRYALGGDQKLQVLRIGSADQAVLGRSGDDLRIEWGYAYMAFPNEPGNAGVLNSSDLTRQMFSQSGKLPDGDDLHMPKAENDGWPAMACTMDFGKIGAKSVSRLVVLAYDDVYSIEYFNRKLRPYWRRSGWGPEELIRAAVKDYPTLKKRCTDFDKQMIADATKAGGSEYAEILSLAYRHVIAAHKLTVDADGTPLLFSKENFSNGCIATVDVAYPASPIFMLFSAPMLKAMLEPVMQYAGSPMWPNDFAPHDLGTYPLANGQVYGGGATQQTSQMPVEESGNMIIMLDVLTRIEGNPSYARQHWATISKWAAYLRSKGMDPENQLCTDDFAGHLAHNTNLSIKAIVALACYSDMAAAMGEKDVAKDYRKAAEEMAGKWKEMAIDGDHYKLAFDQPGTWSMKYNLVWDKILDLKLFDPSIAKTELAYYKKVANLYGIALDSRKTYSKPEWQMFIGTLAESDEDFRGVVAPIHKYVNETPSRVPFTDWYWTTDGKQVSGMQARSVLGGLFIKMLADPAMWHKWSHR